VAAYRPAGDTAFGRLAMCKHIREGKEDKERKPGYQQKLTSEDIE
jgi:hypothetical protein